MPERERTLLFLRKNSKFLSGFNLLFLIEMWYASNSLMLDGIEISNFLAIFLLSK